MRSPRSNSPYEYKTKSSSHKSSRYSRRHSRSSSPRKSFHHSRSRRYSRSRSRRTRRHSRSRSRSHSRRHHHSSSRNTKPHGVSKTGTHMPKLEPLTKPCAKQNQEIKKKMLDILTSIKPKTEEEKVKAAEAKAKATEEKAKVHLSCFKFADCPVSIKSEQAKRSRSPSVRQGYEKAKEARTDPTGGKSGGAKLTLINIAHMPCDIGVLAASFLCDKDVAMLSCCDVLHHQLGTHSTVWKMLYKLRLSNQKGAPALTDELTNKQWRLAYLLQRHTLYGNFCCATTGDNFFKGILGIPLSFTNNPKTNAVDYISSSMDLMSLGAIRVHKVNRDVWGKSFDLWMPLYFTKNHFERALPHIQDAIATLSQAKKFRPEMVLDVFPKIFNTYSVLLSDEGLAACQKSFDGFIAMHRLFLALVKKYKLAKEATRRLTIFMKSENERIKSRCPSLGNLIPFCLVVDVINWSDFMTPYLQECFDRHVLWSCKMFPELARGWLSPQERAQKSFEGAKVSLRLLMFQACFQKLFCQGKLKQRSSQYDKFLAQPRHIAPVSFEKFQEEIKVVMVVDNYFKFFEVIGVTVPSSSTLDQLLRYSVNSSLSKGYHSAHTDFSRIQASGTSRLLSRTHSMQLSKDNLTRVTFRNTWAFEGDIRYLDSTCLLYSDEKQLVSKVDYRHKLGGGGAVTHSGDVMTHNTGSHTMQINLELLPSNITALVFVLSAWSGTLKDILKPAVSFTNATSYDELCQYNLEAHNKQDHQTAVIMCKLYRSGFHQAWHVLAVGESCGGRADQYDSIVHAVGRLL